jgi:hypothetical protein
MIVWWLRSEYESRGTGTGCISVFGLPCCTLFGDHDSDCDINQNFPEQLELERATLLLQCYEIKFT